MLGLSEWFAAKGLKPGHRVAIIIPNKMKKVLLGKAYNSRICWGKVLCYIDIDLYFLNQKRANISTRSKNNPLGL